MHTYDIHIIKYKISVIIEYNYVSRDGPDHPRLIYIIPGDFLRESVMNILKVMIFNNASKTT